MVEKDLGRANFSSRWVFMWEDETSRKLWDGNRVSYAFAIAASVEGKRIWGERRHG
jgi:hypothetical protein